MGPMKVLRNVRREEDFLFGWTNWDVDIVKQYMALKNYYKIPDQANLSEL